MHYGRLMNLSPGILTIYGSYGFGSGLVLQKKKEQKRRLRFQLYDN